MSLLTDVWSSGRLWRYLGLLIMLIILLVDDNSQNLLGAVFCPNGIATNQKHNMKNKHGHTPITVANTAVISAVFGSLEKPRMQSVPNFYMFTDEGDSQKGPPVPRREFLPRLRAKYYRMCTHEFLPNYTAYVWIDGAFEVRPELIQWLINEMGDADASFIEHPDRKTVIQEMDFVYKEMKKGNTYLIERYAKEPMKEQVDSYMMRGAPFDKLPLIATGLFIRRNVDHVNRAFDDWFMENTKWSIQDQLSFPYVLWKHNINYTLISGNYLVKGPHHKYLGHVK